MGTTLITGGAGFIGSHLAEHFLSQGKRVLVVDDLSSGALDNLPDERHQQNLTIVVDSVLNEAALRPLIKQADRVFHLAAVVGVKQIVSDPARVIQTNVFGTAAVLRACVERGCPVLLASSSEVYGKSDRVPFQEAADVVLGPTTKSRWSYACSKAMGEFLGQAQFNKHGLPVVIARLFNTAGARQTGQYGMVIPRFVDQALSGQPITVYGDGSQTRCFCHVADIVSALVKLLETPEAYGEVINLGGDSPLTILELAERVKALTGSSSAIQHIPFEEAYEAGFEDLQIRKPDLSKARALIGFRPRAGLHEILKDAINHRRGLALDRHPSEAL